MKKLEQQGFLHKKTLENRRYSTVFNHVQTEMLMLHLHLQNFEGVFFYWVYNIVTKLDNYNDREKDQWFYLVKILI